MKLLTHTEIRERRLGLRMSQRQLAQLVGVHPKNLCRFELGHASSLRIQVEATKILDACANPDSNLAVQRGIVL
ncbi:MAG TPA: hypothetical protein PL124_11080 [Candidatus Cloacimonadota bacterium]|nr:hypothetical protein [Candidatus Cloacimonadota bacterium]HPS39948.1 hypothetical protein [Candidatus Cloacimonadota bacterium]